MGILCFLFMRASLCTCDSHMKNQGCVPIREQNSALLFIRKLGFFSPSCSGAEKSLLPTFSCFTSIIGLNFLSERF